MGQMQGALEGEGAPSPRISSCGSFIKDWVEI